MLRTEAGAFTELQGAGADPPELGACELLVKLAALDKHSIHDPRPARMRILLEVLC